MPTSRRCPGWFQQPIKGNVMTKNTRIAGIALFAALLLSGAPTSPAAAAPVCYKVLETDTGNYSNSTCTTKVEGLRGQYILSEKLFELSRGVYCAKLVGGALEGTGAYKNSVCTEKNSMLESNTGEFVKVMVPGKSSESTKLLPEPTAGAPLTSTAAQSAEGHLLTASGLEVKCKKGSGSETWTSANVGTGNVLFTECKGPLKTVCNGEGDPEGLIAAKGEVYFWLALLMTGTKEKPTSELVGALVFLLESTGVKFTCKNAILEDVIVVKGCVASRVLEASLNKLISEAKGEFAEWSSGETKILSVLPGETTSEIACLPTTTVNGGAEELSALAGLSVFSEFKKGGSAITIELMNP
jgi:hypothetical protein